MQPGKAGIRKDSWHHWQDEMLAGVVLEYREKGKTMQDAFETAGAMVGKTAAACQLRWHMELKNKHWAYEPGERIAIKQDKPQEQTDNVNRPAHYTAGGIETIEFIKAKLSRQGFIDYCRGNVIKYVTRAPMKGGKEDLLKAIRYLEWAVEAWEDEKDGTSNG